MVKCNECDYTAASTYSVKLHTEKIHEQVVYKCDICDFETNGLKNLKGQ